MKTQIDKKSKYFLDYIKNVLIPASLEFEDLLDDNDLKLHHVFSFNFIVAHAIDHMVFLATKLELTVSRKQFVTDFDKLFYVEGTKYINQKFRLLDAVNNSFKHVELDKKRYKDLISKYGEITFNSLKYENGKIYFETDSYKFDYSRVVLRPILRIFDCEMESREDLISFLKGENCGCVDYGRNYLEYYNDSSDAIDQMIDYCNPICLDCGEYEEDCECNKFFYKKTNGKLNPDTDPNFDLKNVRSQISGTREWQY